MFTRRDAPAALTRELTLSDLIFTGTTGDERKPAVFSRGELVRAVVTVRGFVFRGGKVDLEGELRVHDQEEMLVLEQDRLELRKGAAPTARPGSIRAMASFRLDPAAGPGPYRLALTIHDRLGHRRGQIRATFEQHGRRAPVARRLTLLALSSAADPTPMVGSIVPMVFHLSGVSSAASQERKPSAASYGIALDVSTVLTRPDGTPLGPPRAEPLYRRQLSFRPRELVVEYQLALPAAIGPGSIVVRSVVTDAKQKTSVTGHLPLRIVEPALGADSLHLHDGAHLPRRTFRFGEQVWVRFAIRGFDSATLDTGGLQADLAVAGPEGGVYLARKRAAVLGQAQLAQVKLHGRYPVQLPLTLPTLAPTGRYVLLVRARQVVGSSGQHSRLTRSAQASIPIQLEGTALPAASRLAIDALEIRERPDLPALKGDTLVSGQRYSIRLRIAGAKAKNIAKLTYRTRVVGHLRLRHPRNNMVIDQHRGLFRLERTTHYRPVRQLLLASWQLPRDIPPDLYDLELQLVDEQNNRVAQLIRRIEIVDERGATAGVAK
jgi:hypothetical protein